MAAEIVTTEAFHLGRKIETGSARVDLDDARSTEQLDQLLTAAATQHRHGPVGEYHLRVLDRHGLRVLLDNFHTTG